jgi:hypothetical protein
MHWTSLLIYNEGKDVSIIGIFYLPSKHFLRKNNTKIKNNRPAHFTSSLFFCVAAYQKQRDPRFLLLIISLHATLNVRYVLGPFHITNGTSSSI